MQKKFKNTAEDRSVLFEWIFVIILSACFIAWITFIFLEKRDSRQYALFYAKGRDFLADAVNPIGYASLRDPYNNEMFLGLGEKAYPPLAYLCLYPFSQRVS